MNRLLYLLITILFLTGSCYKMQHPNPVLDLPAETHSGENTFGCLLEGSAYLPKSPLFSGQQSLQADYNNFTGQPTLTITAHRTGSGSICIFGDSITLDVGTFTLTSRKNGSFSAGFFTYSPDLQYYEYKTSTIDTGVLVIKKFDSFNNIASGTFWFDGFDSSIGLKVRVREGRFDLRL